jgi:hypothetical protein
MRKAPRRDFLNENHPINSSADVRYGKREMPRRRWLRFAFIACMTALVTGGSAASAWAQRPDFNGTWSILRHDQPGGRGGAPRNPELTDAGRAMVDEFAARYDVVGEEPGAHCVAAGMPTVMFGLGTYPIDITQNDERITLIAELESQFRRIFLDGRGHPEDYPTTRTGHSVGRWEREGDTEVLVVETTLISEWLVDRWPHSDQVRVVERFALRQPESLDLGPNAPSADQLGDWVLEDRMTVIDPVMYTEPATVTIYFRRVDDYDFIEYDCVEGNWRMLLEEKAAGG